MIGQIFVQATPALIETMKSYDDDEWQDLANLFKLLSDPITIKILGFIGAFEEVSFQEVLAATEVSEPELITRLSDLESKEVIWKVDCDELWFHWCGFPEGGRGWGEIVGDKLNSQFFRTWGGGAFVDRCRSIIDARPVCFVRPSEREALREVVG